MVKAGYGASDLVAFAARGIEVLRRGGPGYPERLEGLQTPPEWLFFTGDLPDWDKVVAIVGTRRATPYGRRTAARMAADLAAAGMTVLSGLASGIDAAAHEGALTAGGATAAVLGCGPDIAYPRSNLRLFRTMRDRGMALLSELPPGTEPARWHFPARNRIVAALATALVVVEAPEKSGALITANEASKLNTDVFVVPGPADAPTFAGSHRLLRDGPRLVTSAADVLEDLGFDRPGVPTQVALPLTPEERTVWEALGPEGARPDELANRLGMTIPAVLGALGLLEIKSAVTREAGASYLRKI